MAVPIDHLDRVFAALADPTRRAILARLAGGEATVNALVAPFGLSQPTVSQHLKVLERAGLVTRGRNAQFRPVRLNAAPLAGAARWLGGYERFWDESLDRLEAYARELEQQEVALASMERAAEPTADREVVIRRAFAVPARFLFEAYRTPAHLKRWFGPKDWPLTLCEIDFRPGGRFRFALTGPDGKQGTPFGGEYQEIVANRKIVYTNAFEEPGAESMVVTVTFDEEGGATTLAIHTLFATAAMKNEYVGVGYVQGVGSGLDQLAAVVAEMQRKVRA